MLYLLFQVPKSKLVRKLWNGVQTQSPKSDIDPRSASDTITQVCWHRSTQCRHNHPSLCWHRSTHCRHNHPSLCDTDPRSADTITQAYPDIDPRSADTITQAYADTDPRSADTITQAYPDIDPRSADTITQAYADTDPRSADTITQAYADTDPRSADTITQAYADTDPRSADTITQAYPDIDPDLRDALNQGELPEIYISVSFDGTWQKRGFISLHGVGIGIHILTGLVVDFVVLYKYCPLWPLLLCTSCRVYGAVSWCFTPSQPLRLYQGDTHSVMCVGQGFTKLHK